MTTNLNKIIDVNYYPVETARRSNLRHRPIGIGVQGLADTFILLGMPFDSPEVIQAFLALPSVLSSYIQAKVVHIVTNGRPNNLTKIYLSPYTTMLLKRHVRLLQWRAPMKRMLAVLLVRYVI